MNARPADSPAPGPLDAAEAMRAATRPLHAQAERTGIFRDLLAGRATPRSYALLLAGLLPAYRALEAGLERHRGARLRALAERDVYRAGAIEHDLALLEGPAWPRKLVPPAEAAAYAARVARAAEGDGLRLAAHAYVRYLGDLNGGRILARVLAHSVGAAASELAFHAFPAIADLAAFRTRYRDAIARIARDDAELRALAAEAVAGFRLNIALAAAVTRATEAAP